ncbi:MAG: MBL fold metallo-hydrolase [Blastocatellia bacterium]|nr:MBL fold metallo-hydrolase [Blastocatellia bacterium]
MTTHHGTPKDAAAMILLRNPQDPEVFWVKRSMQLAFMGGFHAFPGGQRDAADSAVPVTNCDDVDEAALRVCAAREIFEEAGVLVARGVERLTAQRIAELREEMHADRLSFPALLNQEGLVIDADLLLEAPRWVTPPPAPRRFNTYFYAAWVPPCADGVQPSHVIPGELESGEWNRPREAYEKWRRGEVLLAPPVFVPIRELARGVEGFTERLFQITPEEQLRTQGIEFRYGFNMVALRTPTIPPATHTNCYLIGGDEMVVIDPGSPYEEEQQKLDVVIEKLLADGRRIREIIITHLHPDHIGGVMHLSERFQLPVAAHRLTAEAISEAVRVDRFIEDNEIIELSGGQRDPDLHWRLRALWSPGHARGHLSFYEERTGSLITGDCIVGMGTVVIAPPEGNMKDYLASLERLLELPCLTALFPAHGPVLANTRGKIEEYIHHRLEREAMIVQALSEVPLSIPEIVKNVYTDVPEAMHKLAALSVQAHLEKLVADARAIKRDERYALL